MRNRVCRLLKDHGKRVQYSVFECDVKPHKLFGLLRKVAPLLNEPEDSVRVYRLCRECCNTIIKIQRTHREGRKKVDKGEICTNRSIEEPPAFIIV